MGRRGRAPPARGRRPRAHRDRAQPGRKTCRFTKPGLRRLLDPMKFGPLPTQKARGAILAHSVRLADGALKKGTHLSADDCARLEASGIVEVQVAQLSPEDVDENQAATRIGARLASPGLKVTKAVTGRVNLIADAPGLVAINTETIHALNTIDEGLTLATLPDLMRVAADQLVATVKIIPYALPETIVAAGEAALQTPPIGHLPFRGVTARLILTRTPGFRESLLDKGAAIVRSRVEALGYSLAQPVIVPHDTSAVAAALDTAADLTLILGASATSDRADVAPAAVVQAGGRITRFGMPVDPGNLLFLGEIGGNPVVGLPGCARSPALNGVDWVLERLAAGLGVTDAEVAAMGVGGLLKEMPNRPQPRRG